MSPNALKVGDVFKCKRRGHEVIVSAITQLGGSPEMVFYRNGRGFMVSITASRLLNPSRFESMPVEALKDIPAQAVEA